MTPTSTTTFRAIGFCGADDSVHPNMLGMISQSYPICEWGVLFRPDKEGQPRYATMDWVGRLGAVAQKQPNTMKLAAHLCGSRVNDVLNGDDAFLRQLYTLGFRRVQINATAVNGVDVSRLKESAPVFYQVIQNNPDLEFIIQKNEETKPLWKGILELSEKNTITDSPKNWSMLEDESKGTGVAMAAGSWPSPPAGYDIGYAGGIGPNNIRQVIDEVQTAAPGRLIWIDMESSLRSIKNNNDVFDLDKCYDVLHAACELGVLKHPEFLP